MVYKKGYQEFGPVESAVVTKVKGVTLTELNLPGQKAPDLYHRIWDTSDLIVPPSENDAFFITTNVVITPNQTRGTCSEVSKTKHLITDISYLYFYFCVYPRTLKFEEHCVFQLSQKIVSVDSLYP